MSIKEVVDDSTETLDNLREFFSMLLGSKLVSHIHHLQCRGEGSFAKHKALEEFYEGANEIADTIIETYQGYSEELAKYNSEDLTYGLDMETLDYLKTLRQAIEDGRKLPQLEASNLQNEIDNFITLIDQTVYKITFLK